MLVHINHIVRTHETRRYGASRGAVMLYCGAYGTNLYTVPPKVSSSSPSCPRRRDAKLQDDVCQELGQGMSVCYTAGGDCILRVDLRSFHPELDSVTFSQQGGAVLAYASGRRGGNTDVGRPEISSGQPQGGQKPAVVVGAGGRTAGASGKVGDRHDSGALEGKQQEPEPRVGLQEIGSNPSAAVQPAPAAAAALAAPVPRLAAGGAAASSADEGVGSSTGHDGASGAATAAAGAAVPAGDDDLTAILARARALMARSYADEQREREAKQGGGGAQAGGDGGAA